MGRWRARGRGRTAGGACVLLLVTARSSKSVFICSVQTRQQILLLHTTHSHSSPPPPFHAPSRGSAPSSAGLLKKQLPLKRRETYQVFTRKPNVYRPLNPNISSPSLFFLFLPTPRSPLPLPNNAPLSLPPILLPLSSSRSHSLPPRGRGGETSVQFSHGGERGGGERGGRGGGYDSARSRG